MPYIQLELLLGYSGSNGGVVCGQETSASKSKANSQPTPTHAGGDHKLSAAAAFGAPIQNFGGGGVLKNPAAAARPARRRALSCGGTYSVLCR